MVFVGIIWLILTFVIGVAAERRGRSGFGWFLLALFLSPLVAGILLAVFPDKNLRALLEEPRRNAAVDDRALLRNIQLGAGSNNSLLPPVIFIGALAVVLGIVWIGWSKGIFTASEKNISPTIQVVEANEKKEVSKQVAHSPLTQATKEKVSQRSDGVKNGANDWLLAQTPVVQADMLGKTVGERCKGKTAFYQGPIKNGLPIPGTENDAFWSVLCMDGRSFKVEVHPDGSGQVLECSVLKALHGGECFKNF
jgi:hypothetical protein